MTLNPPKRGLVVFMQFVASAQISRVNCDKRDRDTVNQDNLRIGTAKAAARLMCFAQISCITTGITKSRYFLVLLRFFS